MSGNAAANPAATNSTFASSSDMAPVRLQLDAVESTEFTDVDTVAAAVQEDGDLRFVAVDGQLLKSQAAVRAQMRRGRHLFLTPDECFMTNNQRTFELLDDPDPPAESDDTDSVLELNDGRTFNRIALFPHGVSTAKVSSTRGEYRTSALRWHFAVMPRRNLCPPPSRAAAAADPKSKSKSKFQPRPKPLRFDVDIRNVQRVDATTRLTLRLTHCASKVSVVTHFSPKAVKGRFCASFVVRGALPGLYRIALTQFGKGLRGAHVHGIVLRQRNPLRVARARWRPRALHNAFRCKSLNERGADAWVVSLRKVAGDACYVAMTTPFGYVGVKFDGDGQVTMRNGLNFSMWSHDRDEAQPPLHQRPHFLAIDGAGGKTWTFGHEGTGVKVKGKMLPWENQRDGWFTFALTVVPEPDHVFADGRNYTFVVWTWCQGTHTWKRFAVGRDFFSRKMRTGLNLSNFVEVIGPPEVHRSGDIRRDVECRLFARSWQTQQWHRVNDVKRPATQQPENKRREATFDSFRLSMGGVRMEPVRRHDSWASLTSGDRRIANAKGNAAVVAAPASARPQLDRSFTEHNYDAALKEGDVHAELWQDDGDDDGSDDGSDDGGGGGGSKSAAALMSTALRRTDVPEYMQPSKTQALGKAVKYPSIVSAEPVKNPPTSVKFTVHIPEEIGGHNIVTIAAGEDDGLSLSHEWSALYSSGTHGAGDVDVVVPVAKLPGGKHTGLVARVKVANDAGQTWSDDCFDF